MTCNSGKHRLLLANRVRSAGLLESFRRRSIPLTPRPWHTAQTFLNKSPFKVSVDRAYGFLMVFLPRSSLAKAVRSQPREKFRPANRLRLGAALDTGPKWYTIAGSFGAYANREWLVTVKRLFL